MTTWTYGGRPEPMEVDSEVHCSQGASHKTPDTFLQMITGNADDANLGNEVPAYCIKDCDHLRQISFDLLRKDWSQYLDKKTMIEQDDYDMKVFDVAAIK